MTTLVACANGAMCKEGQALLRASQAARFPSVPDIAQWTSTAGGATQTAALAAVTTV